jgi:hypothetical protein
VNPEEAFDKDWIDKYKAQLDLLYGELVRLKSTIFILEKILAYPFHIFTESTNPFWEITTKSLFDSTIHTIWKICYDDDSKALTLKRLRGQMQRQMNSDAHKSQFSETLRRVQFDETLKNHEAKFRVLRNNVLAHFDKEWHLAQLREGTQERIYLTEISAVCEVAGELFNCLCLDHHRELLLGNYVEYYYISPDVDPRTDIEILLDLMARAHPVLNMQETEPGFWPMYRDANLSKADVEILNSYRARFGLTRV